MYRCGFNCKKGECKNKVKNEGTRCWRHSGRAVANIIPSVTSGTSKTSKTSKTSGSGKKTFGTQCPVCLESTECHLSCGHPLCKGPCTDLLAENKCPICRKDFPVSEEIKMKKLRDLRNAAEERNRIAALEIAAVTERQIQMERNRISERNENIQYLSMNQIISLYNLIQQLNQQLRLNNEEEIPFSLRHLASFVHT